MARYTIVIHGGAGTVLKEDMTPELERSYLQGIEDAVQAGYSVLEGGGSAMDAAIAAVISLEDNPLFNAGRGAVFTNKGVNEMDAAVMDGATLKAGAVAGVRNIRNPILLASEVLQNSSHVFLCSEGAMEFAEKQGLKREPDDYFFTRYRHDQWSAIKDTETTALDHGGQKGVESLMKDKKFGTVGAVACDGNGHVAAATSTGGMTNKKYGRVGDSPVIGGGTYANDTTCAISCTGHGELFIRAVAAYDVSCLMEYKGLSLQEALDIVVKDKLIKLGGEGGIIGVDAQGNGAMVFNSSGMYRGLRSSDGEKVVGIYPEEK